MNIQPCGIVLVCGLLALPARAGEHVDRPTATAIETIVLARELCGHELTQRGDALAAGDKDQQSQPEDSNRKILSNLWRETWACNENFTGGNCFAARWQLCARAYGEYGPDGILMPGLIKVIVKK